MIKKKGCMKRTRKFTSKKEATTRKKNQKGKKGGTLCCPRGLGEKGKVPPHLSFKGGGGEVGTRGGFKGKTRDKTDYQMGIRTVKKDRLAVFLLSMK